MTRDEFMDVVHDELYSDGDNNRANRIIDAADDYANEYAQPERIKGRWIYHPEWENDGECGYECSVCHMGSDVDYNFCMRCGADMRT